MDRSDLQHRCVLVLDAGSMVADHLCCCCVHAHDMVAGMYHIHMRLYLIHMRLYLIHMRLYLA
jgi:hypothetical protein